MCILLHFVNKIRGVCEISQQLKMQTLHSFGISAFGERVVINTLQIQLYFKAKYH